uniref:ATP synthase complex subunit 8 n=1 Tax=Aphyosemion coeleste TaxID=60277 RepID=A0A517U6Z2_9TELE|nr:ATP synthase F0 subunit 8 [Aphyosemion coeleste]QDT76395.1 ATP synthase F0 subunit 8 [Aphyosemion coeleste]
MPQLNPAPWFTILIFTWMIFLMILPKKVLAYKYPNDPGLQSLSSPKTELWNWPWH